MRTKLKNKRIFFWNKAAAQNLSSGEFNYRFQFKILFQILGGYRETEIINIVIPSSDQAEAKSELEKFVKENIKIKVMKIKQL